MGIVKIPEKKTWSQAWTPWEAKQIQHIAERLRCEVQGKTTDRDLWLNAEGEFTAGVYEREHHEKRR